MLRLAGMLLGQTLEPDEKPPFYMDGHVSFSLQVALKEIAVPQSKCKARHPRIGTKRSSHRWRY